VSSSPLLPLGEGTLIRPLSFVPAILLLGVAGIRILFLNQRPNFNRDDGCFATLFCFTIYVLISGLVIIAFLPDAAFKGQTPLESFVRGFATLLIGIVFYSLARLYIRTRTDALLVQKFLFVGIGGSILLAVYQVAAIFIGGDVLRDAQALTDIFAVRTTGLLNRGQGMGLEASALGYQITVLLLPFLVARGASGQAFVGLPKRKGNVWATLPGYLLALVGLLCAGSRFGIGSAVAIITISSLRALWRGRVLTVLAFATLVTVGTAGTTILSNLRVGAGSGYFTNAVSSLVDISSLDGLYDPDTNVLISDAISVSGRAAASQSAATLWFDNPLFGVSLGNTFRYFGRYVPDWAIDSLAFNQPVSEGFAWLDPSRPERANAKNFLIRLLAETGLFGTLLFLLFFFRHAFFVTNPDPYFGAFRTAAIAALCLNWLNSDTFADPAMWIMLALCHAGGRIGEQRLAASGILRTHSAAT
jgi:hypothetical protein